MSFQAKHLLITGRPGSGKTTLLRKLAARLPGLAVGFWTEETRVQGARQGFQVVTTWGSSGPLARVGLTGPLRVGRYGVDLRFLEEEAIPGVLRGLASPETTFIVIDEIGKMELLSTAFRGLLEQVLASGKPLVATIGQGGDPLLDHLRSRPDSHVVTVAPACRDHLARVLVWREGWVGSGGR